MRDPETRTVTLSDEKVWVRVRESAYFVWQDYRDMVPCTPSRVDGQPLTASDHRAIAHVLDPQPLPLRREDVEGMRRTHILGCISRKGLHMHEFCDCGAWSFNEGIDAVLSKMESGTPTQG